MDASWTLIIVGLVLSGISWVFFRKPSVPFWFKGPVWRANHYVKPAGVVLWALGSLICVLGLFFFNA